ncbi:MAG: glycosyltransferase [Candidatus Micrarchaeia archaeon]
MKRFSLIIPVYNEIDNLKKNLPKIYREVKRLKGELIVAEDGSTDGSKEYIKEFARNHEIKFITSKKRLGRGKAIKRALKISNSKVIGYMDSDLAIGLKNVEKAVKLVEKGNPIVVGSRYKSKKTKRSLKRLIASKFYNFLLRIFFNSKVSDHQCGFKFWKSNLKNFLKGIKDNHWFFDSELLIKAQKKKIKILELPVEYKEQKRTKVKISEIFYFLKKIFELRKELSQYEVKVKIKKQKFF